jgi:hypothetical protein
MSSKGVGIFAGILWRGANKGAMIHGSADDKAAQLQSESQVGKQKKSQNKFDPALKTGI